MCALIISGTHHELRFNVVSFVSVRITLKFHSRDINSSSAETISEMHHSIRVRTKQKEIKHVLKCSYSVLFLSDEFYTKILVIQHVPEVRFK